MSVHEDTVITLRMTLHVARSYSLLSCRCGHPNNNHFDFNERPCAHCDCKGFAEVGRHGIAIVKVGRRSRAKKPVRR